MKIGRSKVCVALAGVLSLIGGAEVAFATEGGGSIYPHGVETFLVGALPPPGTYFLNTTNYYHASRVNDGSGNKAVPHFRLDAVADSLRFVHVTDLKLLGANVGAQIIVPLVSLDVNANGAKQSKSGLGDATITPLILGWHFDKMHYVAALDFNVPTGEYSKNDIANLGRNYLEIEPVFAVTYLDPAGLELSAKFMYDFNYENRSTDYKSGQEFHFDYAAGWNVDAWTVGVSGYYYKQTTDDEQYGMKVGPNGNRGEAFALGPAVKYAWKGMQFWGSWQNELVAHNRTQGDKFWLRFSLPL